MTVIQRLVEEGKEGEFPESKEEEPTEELEKVRYAPVPNVFKPETGEVTIAEFDLLDVLPKDEKYQDPETASDNA